MTIESLTAMKNSNRCRCPWCGSDPLYIAYHDKEWGVPVHEDQHLFEMLILEGAQAGLSWLTILKKRQNYRRAFQFFEIEKVAVYAENEVQDLLADAGIVRNRLKIASVIKNARGALQIQEEFGSLDTYLWNFVDGIPHQNSWQCMDQVPTRTAVSDAMSKDLKHRGFNFIGTTICYSFMQAIGMVNDHILDCFRHSEVQKSGA